MAWQQCLMDLFLRVARDLDHVLADLTVGELHYQPSPASNSIAWLAWHLTRSHDRNVSELAGQEQLWVADGWYSRFHRAPDPTETGVGHSAAEAAAFRAPDTHTLLAYHQAAIERLQHYIMGTLSEHELARETYSPTLRHSATVQQRLVGMLSEGLQHVGQAAYGRGLLKGHGWLGR